MPPQYDEFRVQIAPDIAVPAQFTLQLLETPLNAMAGPLGAPTAQFLPADLATLRNPATFSGGNLLELQRIGGAVYRAVTNPTIEAALNAAIAFSTAQQRRLRIVFSTIAVDTPQQQTIRVSELPIEAIYTTASGFYAPLLGNSCQPIVAGEARPSDRRSDAAASHPAGRGESDRLAACRHRS